MDSEKIVKLIDEEDKGIISYQELDADAPIYYNDRINILDDLKSLDLGTWKKIKTHMKLLYSKSKSLFFVSHKEDEIIGKPQLIEEHKKNIVLCHKFTKTSYTREKGEDTIIHYKFIDDNVNRRDDGKAEATFSYWFWIYKIVDNDREYILMSEKKLTPDLYRFRGMKIILNDNSEISKTLKFDSLTNIFIAVEEEKAIKSLDKNALIQHIGTLKDKYGLNEESFKEFLFTHPEDNKIYSHTEDYTKLMISFLLSGKYEGYPLHLMILGPLGKGKTKSLECIHNIFDEEKEIFEAGNSTIKGLIPSFREKPAHVGYILECVRIGLIDELFKMMEKSETGQDLEYLKNYLNQLNMLLEHKDRTIGSGNDTIRAKATAKLLLMTNAYRTKKTIYEHVGIVDISTFSRFIPLVQDYEERKLIDKKEIKTNRHKKMTGEEFLTIFDSCQSFICEYDEERVKEIDKRLSELTKYSMREVWKARGLHHSILLLDGIVKFRCLFEGDNSFKAKDQDYQALEKLIIYIINSWDCGLRDWAMGDGL